MIGIRALLSAVAAPLLIVPLLGTPGTDPSAALEARRLIAVRAERADSALARLQDELAPGLEAGRAGAARVVSGADRPGPALRDAATRLEGAGPVAADVGSAIGALVAALRAGNPDHEPPQDPVAPGEVESIAAQLRGTAEAADSFAAMRRRAEGVPAALDAALAALEAGDLDTAADEVVAARADHAALAAWEVDFPTLPVWLDTTDAMIGAVETIIDATRRGDRPAAEGAAAAFAALDGDAATADRALRIALGEGGSAVTSAPLGRLADLLRRAAEARQWVASILQAVGR